MLQPGAHIPDLLPPAARVAPGQRLLLYFYPKSDTPACTMEACSFRDNLTLLRAQDVEIVGVSPDSAAVQEAFARKYALPFTLLADTDGALAQAFGVAIDQLWAGKTFQSVSRTTFLIDAEGIVRQVWEHVDPRQHVQQVIAALDALDAEASRRNLQEARQLAPRDVVSPFASARQAEARLADLRRAEHHEPGEPAPSAVDGHGPADPVDPAQVNAVLDVLRPYMQADGGDVELVGIQDGIVQVRLKGACGTCPSASVTLKLGLEAQLKQRVAGIVAVEAVF
jgi:peroxiredoxin Q/BCP